MSSSLLDINLIKANNKGLLHNHCCVKIKFLRVFVLFLINLNPAFYPVSYTGKRLTVASSGSKLSLDGRIYETDAVSVNFEHLGTCA